MFYQKIKRLSFLFLILFPFASFAGTLNFSAGQTMTIDSEMTAQETMCLSSGVVFKGSGYLKAPRITITSQNFEFTGTIECDQECTITTQKPFAQKMFTRKGKGKFIFIVNPELDSKDEQALYSPLYQPEQYESADNTIEQSISLKIKGLTPHIAGQTKTALVDAIERNDVNDTDDEPTVLKIGQLTFHITGKTKKDLFAAIKRNDLKEFIKIFEEDINLKNNPEELRILLIIAGVHDALSIAKELIMRGAPIDKSRENSSSPLLVAAFTQNKAFAALLIDSGANVNEYNQDCHTPLHLAAQNNDLEMLNLLLNATNINIDARDSQGRTPLMLACRLEGKKIMEALIAKNANIFKKDINGRVAADYAFPFYQELFRDLQNEQINNKPVFNTTDETAKTDVKTIADEKSSSLIPTLFSIGILSIASYYVLDLYW